MMPLIEVICTIIKSKSKQEMLEMQGLIKSPTVEVQLHTTERNK